MTRNSYMKLGLLFLILLPGVACRRGQQQASSQVGGTKTANAVNGGQSGTILKKISPVYPPLARLAHIEGTVILHAIIAEDGTVESLEAISGPRLLQGAAADGVKQWVYKPYLVDGKPRKVDTKITVNFRLNKAATH